MSVLSRSIALYAALCAIPSAPASALAADPPDALESRVCHNYLLGPEGPIEIDGVPTASVVDCEGYGGFYLTFNDEVVYDADGDHQTTGDQVLLNGSILIDPLDVDLCSSFLSESCDALIELSWTVTVSSALELSADLEAELFSWESDAVEFYLVPIPIAEGVSITPVLRLAAAVDATAEARLTTSLVQQYSVTQGFDYDWGSYTPISETPDFLVQYSPPELSGESGIDAEIHTLVDLAFPVDFIIGPYMGIDTYGRLEVRPVADPWWELIGGIEMVAGEYDVVTGTNPLATLLTGKTPLADAGGSLVDVGNDGWARWSRSYDLSDAGNTGFDIAAADGVGDSRQVIVGENGIGTGWILTLDQQGMPIHQRRFLHGYQPLAIESVAGAGYVVVGDRNSAGTIWISRLDSELMPVWTRSYTSAITARADDLELLSDGSIVVCGEVVSADKTRALLMRVDPSDGTVLWAKTYRGGQLYEVDEASAGGLVAVGKMNDSDGYSGQSIYVLRTDSDGSPLWSRELNNGGSSNAGRSITETSDGDFVVAGAVRESPFGGECYKSWIGRIDPDGDLEWSMVYATEGDGPRGTGDTPWDYFSSIESAEGGYLVCGKTELGDDMDSWVLKIDEQGEIVYWKSFQGLGLDELKRILTTDDGWIAFGTSESFDPPGEGGEEDLWVVKCAHDGMLHFDESFDAWCWNEKPKREDLRAALYSDVVETATEVTMEVAELEPETEETEAEVGVLED